MLQFAPSISISKNQAARHKRCLFFVLLIVNGSRIPRSVVIFTLVLLPEKRLTQCKLQSVVEILYYSFAI